MSAASINTQERKDALFTLTSQNNLGSFFCHCTYFKSLKKRVSAKSLKRSNPGWWNSGCTSQNLHDCITRLKERCGFIGRTATNNSLRWKDRGCVTIRKVLKCRGTVSALSIKCCHCRSYYLSSIQKLPKPNTTIKSVVFVDNKLGWHETDVKQATSVSHSELWFNIWNILTATPRNDAHKTLMVPRQS